MNEITIVIIEENIRIRELLARKLNRHPLLNVVGHTGDFAVGTELAWFWEPDIVLADIRPSDVTGWRRCREVAQASPSSRLVVFASYLLEGDEEAYLRAGAAKCLLKGLSVGALTRELISLAEPNGDGLGSRISGPAD